MTLAFPDLKHNLVELCSASKTGQIVPSVTGETLYDKNKGWGALHRCFFVLCSYSGKAPPVSTLLKSALEKTAKSYEEAIQKLSLWLDAKREGKNTSESELEHVVFICSFHKACKDQQILLGIQAVFQNHASLVFSITLLPNFDFYRRVDTFERITQAPFPFALIKKAIHDKFPKELESDFKEYEKKVLQTPLQFISEAEKRARKSRITDKLVKILKDLGPVLQVKRDPVYQVWGMMNCTLFMGHVSDKRMRQLESIREFAFTNVTYKLNTAPAFNFDRMWTAVSIGSSKKEVIVFHSVLAGPAFISEREENEIIPINPAIEYRFETGFFLKNGHRECWGNIPLSEYEKELVKLVKEYSRFERLPVDPPHNLMDIESYGFDKEGQLTVKLNYNEMPYHSLTLQDFLFKAVKRNVKDYFRLFKECELEKAPMGKQVGDAFISYFFEDDDRAIKIAAIQAETSEADFKKFWVDPFENLIKFVNTNNDADDIKRVTDNYYKMAFGCYPFEGVIEYLLKPT